MLTQDQLWFQQTEGHRYTLETQSYRSYSINYSSFLFLIDYYIYLKSHFYIKGAQCHRLSLSHTVYIRVETNSTIMERYYS